MLYFIFQLLSSTRSDQLLGATLASRDDNIEKFVQTYLAVQTYNSPHNTVSELFLEQHTPGHRNTALHIHAARPDKSSG